nr:hypothetical protein [Candidatus Kuenenia stuttgartiensis]
MNDTKPYGNILDFRMQTKEVDEAIALFCGQGTERAKEIWLVDPAPEVIEKYKKAVAALGDFMQASDLVCEPQEVYNLKGDTARINFINRFKEIQRVKTQLDQYTDLTPEQKAHIETLIPEDQLRSFRSSYLETAKQLKERQQKEGINADPSVQQLDFEFVLFASAVIDYDYIMKLISRFTQNKPGKQKMTREQLIDLLSSSANLIDEREDIVAYINSLEVGKGLDEKEIKEGYQKFKTENAEKDMAEAACKHG